MSILFSTSGANESGDQIRQCQIIFPNLESGETGGHVAGAANVNHEKAPTAAIFDSLLIVDAAAEVGQWIQSI